MKTGSADVVIVGAGTSGAYMAWRLARAGFRCVVVEKEQLDAPGETIGPFHMEEVAFERFGIPRPRGDELLHTIREVTMWSPSLEHSFTFELPTFVMDKPKFIRRLHGYALDAGAEILERTEVRDIVLERGFPSGVRAVCPGGGVEVRARLVIDASGIDGAVRTRMPAGGWFENDAVSERDTIFVYMETWKEVNGDLRPGINSYPYFQGWCAPGPGDTRIVGIGAGGSREAAVRRHREFTARLPYSGKVAGSTGGRVPYRRPPYSLVDDGVMVVGDAAFMNKPFSGEGVTSAFTACGISVEVAASALERDDLTRDALWPYNVRYIRDQGAKFAFLTSMLPAVMSMRESEMDFLFTVPGIFTEDASLALQLDYEVKQKPAQALKTLPAVLRGIAGGELAVGTLLSLAKAAVTAGSIKKHYRCFPDKPQDFGPWVREAAPLWSRADAVKHRYFDTAGVSS